MCAYHLDSSDGEGMLWGKRCWQGSRSLLGRHHTILAVVDSDMTLVYSLLGWQFPLDSNGQLDIGNCLVLQSEYLLLQGSSNLVHSLQSQRADQIDYNIFLQCKGNNHYAI